MPKTKRKQWAYYRTLETHRHHLVYRVDSNQYSTQWIKDNLAVDAWVQQDGEWIFIQDFHLKGYYRCKKDGSWYSSSEGQIINRRWLSLSWQISGALASLGNALERACLSYMLDVEALKRDLLAEIDYKRRKRIEQYHIGKSMNKDKK